jgi:hypothetical protein
MTVGAEEVVYNLNRLAALGRSIKAFGRATARLLVGDRSFP